MYAYLAFLIVFLTYGMEPAFFRFKQKNEVRDFLLIKYENMTMSSDTLFLVSEFLKLKLEKEIVKNIYNPANII